MIPLVSAADVAVTVLARCPVPGRAKTRLAATVGDRRAAELHEALTLDLLEDLAGAGVRLVLALEGETHEREAFAATARSAIPDLAVEAQAPGDLGPRMLAALHARLAEGASVSLVVGADCLDVASALPSAARALQSHDAALVPALDGGYVLLGLGRPIAPDLLDGLPWGSAQALAATLAALTAGGLRAWVDGTALDDVDDGSGLLRMSERLARPGSPRAPRVRKLMR